ncbi:MAG TPA: TIGR04255 family protein [Pirellulales bacterium]|nr:TIGR04255 family protein [Pirellulales bacterium]
MAIPNRNGSSPDYERPPVVETVLGVQFDQIVNFGNAQLGAFWKTLDLAEWASVTDAPALVSQFEQFGDAVKWQPQLGIQFTQVPRTRLQIKNSNGDRMIQIQDNRVHFNWSKSEESSYPRYPAVRNGFEYALRRFVDFISEEHLGEFRPNQWEVTYINNIPKGTVWRVPSDWGFFRLLAGVSDVANLVDGESFSGEWHFQIPDQRGRLHIQWQHGLAPAKPPEHQETVWLTLTARGSLGDAADPLRSVVNGLDLGHHTIVNSFRTLMSDEANTYWGLKK